MPLENIYVARQPIVNVANDLVGFELLFRSTEDNAAHISDSIDATSTVVANVFTEIAGVEGHCTNVPPAITVLPQ